MTAALQRDRCRRLETIGRQRDPAFWSNPALEGEVDFLYDRSPAKTITMGYGQHFIALRVSSHRVSSIRVYKDPIHAVGINGSGSVLPEELAAQLTPGGEVTAEMGGQVILQNEVGVLCLIDVIGVQVEATAPNYKPASVRFRYRILSGT